MPSLPEFSGHPIRVVVRASLGEHHAATSIPRRIIYLDSGVLVRRGEFERILIHELFHFVWVRLSNATRFDWELQLSAEMTKGEKGELGWSADIRKQSLARRDIRGRSSRWRQYCCESFCDTAAFIYGDLRRHEEFTLPASARKVRREWFSRRFSGPEPVCL